ncbi:hypothetical protein L6V77_35055 [Myxococcota bacterium]|nr:hypothetical protein [Myxococcota bacterium]
MQAGQLSGLVQSDLERVLCYHPNGRIHSVFQTIGGIAWSNTMAKGTTYLYDANGNKTHQLMWDRPADNSYAREVEYVYDSTMKDRVQYVRQRLTPTGSWSLLTSDTTLPTYFAFGGFKSLQYANGVDQTDTRDKAYRLKGRKTAYGATPMTDVNLTYDVGGNITVYDDSAGYRHLTYYTAYDALRRLRCVSRASIAGCSGAEPWEDKFNESFDYDLSGNRTNRRRGAFGTADDDAYSYVTSSDVICAGSA